MEAEAARDRNGPPAEDLRGVAAWRDLVADGRAAPLALVLLGCWVFAADSLVTATIMPSVGRSLEGYAWFGWAGSGFMTGLVVAGASAGWLAERIGLRAGLVLAGTAFAAGCATSAAAPDILLFLVGRVVQGVAAGWLVGLVYVALALMFPGRHLPRVFALATSVWGVATFIGPLIGGLFADAGHWRGVFWLFGGQALLFAAASRRLVPTGTARGERSRMPAATLGLLAAGIGAIATAGVVESVVLAVPLAGTGLALLVAALAVDRTGSNGLLPRRAHDPDFPLQAAWITYFATSAAAVAFALYAPAMLQFTAGLSALEAGYVVAAEALAWTLASLSVAGAGETWRQRLIVAGAASILAGATAIALVMDSGNLPAVLAASLLLGAGFGMSYSFISQRVIGAFGGADRTRGSAAIATVRNAGAALGAALAGIGANAAAFGDGLDAGNASHVAWGAFGIGIPFAMAGLAAAIRLTRATPASVQAGLAPAITESA